jgi:DNA-binding CsgD family transcriptional regulator
VAQASWSRPASRDRTATSGGGRITAPRHLLGRDAHLSHFRQLLDAGRSVVLVGEPGIGKTALLRALAAERRSFQGGALGLLGFLPYLALVRAVGTLPDGDPGVLAREIVRRVGADGLLVLDDLHWADEGTLDLVDRVTGSVTILSAVRTSDRASQRVIARLAAAGCEVIDVPPLPDDVAATLARTMVPGLSPDAVREVVVRAGGNALYVEELARSGVTTSLRRAVQHRLHGLGPSARALLELLAVAQEPIRLGASARGLRHLESADLVETVDRGSAVRHALIAEVVVEGLSQQRLAALHRAAAGRTDDVLRAARHLVQGGDRPAARRAALSALASAPPGQRALLAGIAAECADGPSATDEQVDAARRLVDAGWFGEAERILDLAHPGTRADRARLLAVRAHTRWGLGDADGAVAAAEEGLDELARDPTGGDAPDDALRAQLLTDLAWSVTLQRNGGRAVPLAREALAAAVAAGLPVGPPNRVLALALSIAEAPFEATMPYLEVALAEARAIDDVAEELLCGKLAVAGHEGGGDGAEGRRLGEAFVGRARAAGMVAWEQSIRATLVSLANSQGHVAQAILEGTELLAEPLERRTRSQAAGYLALALVDTGRLDDARRLIDDALALAPRDIDGRLDLLWARVELALAGGDYDHADSLADAILDEFRDADYCDLRHVRVTQAWARHEAGRDPGLPIAAVPMHAHVRGTVPESRAVRLMHDAGGDSGSPALLEAARLFMAATAEYAPFHRRSEMRCRWARGEALRLAGRADDARDALLGAEAEAARLGLLPLGARIRRSLRLLGERRHAPRRAGGLVTAREREVLDLVGAGLTNSQIAVRLGIGRPTVARLVSNAAAKLGTTSRAQIAAYAAEVD